MGIISAILLKVAPESPLSHTFYPPPSKFVPSRDIPDLTGKTVIVTGANTGIGYHTVRELLLKNAKVYLAARSPIKASEAIESLEKDIGKAPLPLQLDLNDLLSIKRAAEEFLSKEEKLDILFNNAGIMIPPPDQLTVQGYDPQFGINVLGHYYFTVLLLSALQRSTIANGEKARVVNVSSSGHIWAPNDGIEWSSIKGGPERNEKLKEWGVSDVPGKGAQWILYGQSKIGNIFVSNILNRYHGNTLNSYSLHPGGIRSDLQRHGSTFHQWMTDIVLHPTAKGTLTQLWAGTMPEAENAVGAYLIPWARIGRADPRAANEKLQDELKAWLDKQIEAVD